MTENVDPKPEAPRGGWFKRTWDKLKAFFKGE